MQWPAPFSAIAMPDMKIAVEDELRREVKPGHPLFGVPVAAIGQGEHEDDVLFELRDGSGRVAEVHLTWAGLNERPPCPRAVIYDNFAAWAESFGGRDDFADMLAIAAQDTRVTPARVIFEQARSGSYALLGAAALHVVIAFLFMAVIFPGFTHWQLPLIIVYSSAACVFIGLFFWAQRDRVAAAWVGFVLYCLLIAPSVLATFIDPTGILWLFELMALFALLDGLRAARHQRRLLRQAMTSRE